MGGKPNYEKIQGREVMTLLQKSVKATKAYDKYEILKLVVLG